MSPWYALDRRIGGPQSRSARRGEEKNSDLLPELEPPIIQPAAQRSTTELYRILILVGRRRTVSKCGNEGEGNEKAKNAQVHSFIMSFPPLCNNSLLPDGFGHKGT
jgi:hypothetical protein